jgi:hypothetical protein
MRQNQPTKPIRRHPLTIAPLVGCAKRAAECVGNLSRCPFLECVLKVHERTLKEKCPLGKKDVDGMPIGQYPTGEMRTKFRREYQRLDGSWVSLVEVDGITCGRVGKRDGQWEARFWVPDTDDQARLVGFGRTRREAAFEIQLRKDVEAWRFSEPNAESIQPYKKPNDHE